MEHTIDIEKVTCDCQDFKYRRSKKAKGAEERRCKHLAAAMTHIPFTLPKGWSEKKRHERAECEPVVKKVSDILSATDSIESFVFCGSYRRQKPTIGDLDILVLKANDDWTDNITIIDSIAAISEKVMVSGEQKSSVLIDGIQVDIRFIKKKDFIFQVMHATGSKEENVRLRSIAKKKDMALSEYGLHRNVETAPELVPGLNSEEDVYAALGIPFVPPEKR